MYQTIFTVLHPCRAVLAMSKMSICPSICEMCELWQNERNLYRNCTTWKTIHPSFMARRTVGWGRLLLHEILRKTDPVGVKSLEQSTHRPQDRHLLNGCFQTMLEDLALQTCLWLIYRPIILQLFYQWFIIIIIIIVIIILIIILSLPFYVMSHQSLLVL